MAAEGEQLLRADGRKAFPVHPFILVKRVGAPCTKSSKFTVELSPRHVAFDGHPALQGSATKLGHMLPFDFVQQRFDKDLVRFRRSERRFVVVAVLRKPS